MSAVKIHYDALAFLSDQQKQLYGSSLTLFNLPSDFFSRKSEISSSAEIEIPAEHFEAGVHILDQFVAFMRRKFPDGQAKFKIQQQGLKLLLTAGSMDGHSEFIESMLDDNGLIPVDELSVHEVLRDKDLIVELQTEMKEVISASRHQNKYFQEVHGQINKLLVLLKNSQNGASEVQVLENPPPKTVPKQTISPEHNNTQNTSNQNAIPSLAEISNQNSDASTNEPEKIILLTSSPKNESVKQTNFKEINAKKIAQLQRSHKSKKAISIGNIGGSPGDPKKIIKLKQTPSGAPSKSSNVKTGKPIKLSQSPKPKNPKDKSPVQKDVVPIISMIQGNLNDLVEELPNNSNIQDEIAELNQSLTPLKTLDCTKALSESSGLSELRKFFKNLTDEESELVQVVIGLKQGLEVVEDLTKNYNDLAVHFQ